MKELVFFALAAALLAVPLASLTSAYYSYSTASYYPNSAYSGYNSYAPELDLFNYNNYDYIRVDGKLKTTYTSFDPFGGSKKTTVKLVYDNYRPFASSYYAPSYYSGGYSGYPNSYSYAGYPSSYNWYYGSSYYYRDQNYDYRYRYIN